MTEFKVGDAVFGQPSNYVGAHAEYICMRETAPLALKPATMSFEEAAAVCDGAAQALSALRLADASPGRRIVVYGASGSLGTAAVQLAKHFGAHVTAVCGSAHMELVQSLGADEVVDYRSEDFTRRGRNMGRDHRCRREVLVHARSRRPPPGRRLRRYGRAHDAPLVAAEPSDAQGSRANGSRPAE